MKNKADYGNWVPAAMMKMMTLVSVILIIAAVLLCTLTDIKWLKIIAVIAAAVMVLFTAYMGICRHIFASGGPGKNLPNAENYIRIEGLDGVMGRIHHFLAEHLDWDGKGQLLDIGCGSGALTIRCAKKYPNAQLTGIDYWGTEWSYGKEQCERNAGIEGVADRITFRHGDAAKLDFADETFDAAVSNFVFHEVKSQPDKPELIKEALRVVKKGGSFAFQDLFCQKSLYGDINEVISELKASGVSEINFIPDVEKLGFVPAFVQTPWMISGIGLIYGKK